MAKIEKRQNKDGTYSYIAQVRRVGHPSVTRSFASKGAADSWKTRAEERVRAGTFGQSERMTFSQLLEEVEPRLRQPYKAALEYWRAQLGSLRIARISPALLDVHRDRLLGAPCRSHKHKKTKPRSATTTWHYLQQLSRVFSVADEELHLIEFNPVSRVCRPSLPDGRKRFLNDDELAWLFDACRLSESKALFAFVLFLVTTGARCGEAYGLLWEHLDVERRWALFPTTKNGNARGVPITQALLDVLMALEREPNATHVFPQRLDTAWGTARERAGIGDFRLHDLRHTCASRLVKGGATLPEVGRLLGHKDPRMTDRYSHLDPEHTQALVDRILGSVK